jgi:hypothetical protein
VDADLHSVRRAFQNDINGLGFVLTIAMKDGVGDGLAHGHVNTESSIIADSKAAYEFSDRGGRGGNRFDFAG